MKLFLIALAIATIALSDCGVHPAENTALQAQAKLITKHKAAIIFLLEMTHEEFKEKISVKGASVRAKEKRVAEINKLLPTLNGEQLTSAAEEKNTLPGKIKELAEEKKRLETRQQQITELLQELKKD